MISTMKTMFQTGLNEHVPVPPEKGFLIHSGAQPASMCINVLATAA
jgi:hypothetical protein